MGAANVPALHRLVADVAAEAGPGSEPLAASAGGDLGTALLPIVALAASVVAAVAVGSLIVAWLQKPAGGSVTAVTDPKTAGLLAVGFVSGGASQRWLAATVVQLACEGVIAIEDRRDAGGGTGGEEGRGRDIRLVFDADPRVAYAAAESRDTAAGSLVATFGVGSHGGRASRSIASWSGTTGCSR